MINMDLGKCDDLTGRVFGRLTVTEFAGRNKNGLACWKCLCSCGNVVAGVRRGNLQSGNTTSCGCYNHETAVSSNTTHGLSGSSEWSIWRAMVDRCTNKSNDAWSRYGGRGIVICDEWPNFEAFYADMGPRPSRDHSIDRRDNNGPYAPWNCFWATRLEQANNKSNNVLMTHLGETRTMAQWCTALGLRYNAVWSRKRRGWSDEDALTKPVRQNPTN